MTTIDELTVEPTAIAGLLRISPKAVTDDRGTVREFFRATSFAAAGVDVPARWTQVNVTTTKHGAIRGLHGEATDKLIGVVAGEAFGAYLDARADSPTRGAVVTLPLRLGRQVFVPAGVCNGFQATSPNGCEYLYCFGVEWQPGMPGTAVSPLDPDLGIDWPIRVDVADPTLVSPKDASAPRFKDL